MAFARETGDLLTKLFYQYTAEQAANSFARKPPQWKNTTRYNMSTNAKAGGVKPPFRVNKTQRTSTFRGRYCGKDCSKVATRGYVKKALEKNNIGKEVTTNNGNQAAGTLVDYRLCKNIDKGDDSGDRTRGTIQLLGFRVFGSLYQTGVTSSVSMRFLLVQDKTPGRLIREALFSTISDARTPVDFVDGTTLAPINVVRPINTDRFTVLHDWVERMTPDSSTEGLGRLKTFNRFFKLNKKITFNANYNTSEAELLPSYHLLYYPIADSGLATTTVERNLQFEEYFID